MHLDRIELATPDLAAVKGFYHDLLGFRMLHKQETYISFAVGSSVLMFIQSRTSAFYHFAFLIPSNQFQEAYDWVASKTTVLPFTGNNPFADFRNWNAQAFYFHDTAENIVEIIVHHDLQNHAENAFSAQSIFRICEIGIPVRSVTEACHHFNERYNIPYYKKGPRLTDFAVMGDEDGLLIVTTTGRGWLPTQRPAEQHRLQLQLTHGGATTLLHDENLPK